MVTLFLTLTVAWFLYAFARFVQELIWGLRNVPRAVTNLKPVYNNDKNELTRGGLAKDTSGSGIKND